MKVISSFGIFKTIYHNDKYLLLLQSFEILDQTSVFLPSKKIDIIDIKIDIT